jgi:hypothetical protein
MKHPVYLFTYNLIITPLPVCPYYNTFISIITSLLLYPYTYVLMDIPLYLHLDDCTPKTILSYSHSRTYTFMIIPLAVHTYTNTRIFSMYQYQYYQYHLGLMGIRMKSYQEKMKLEDSEEPIIDLNFSIRKFSIKLHKKTLLS